MGGFTAQLMAIHNYAYIYPHEKYYWPYFTTSTYRKFKAVIKELYTTPQYVIKQAIPKHR